MGERGGGGVAIVEMSQLKIIHGLGVAIHSNR